MPLVTVILLTYNHEDSIAKALDSILEQDTNFDFNIFVLEDCSTDKTAQICKEYKQRYPERIELFLNKRNLGVAENYLQGLQKVEAKYYAFLEGDDTWCNKNKLQMQVEALEANPDCMIAGHDTLYKDIKNQSERSFTSKYNCERKTKYNIEDDFRVHPSSRLYRNCIDLTNVPSFMVFDKRQYMLYLSKGDLYYIDKPMSIYNKTGSGFWSGKAKLKKKLMTLQLNYKTNKFFNFEYDHLFRSKSPTLVFLKKIFGIRLGWSIYYRLENIRIHLKFLFKRQSG